MDDLVDALYYSWFRLQKEKNEMNKSWFDIAKEGHLYAIDDEGNVVDFGKAYGCEVETCVGCEPEITFRVTPKKVMKNEGASAYSFERECVEYHALKCANEENKKLIEKLKKENEEFRQKLANYESDFIKRHSMYGISTTSQYEYSIEDVYATSTMFAENDPYAVYLSTRRSNGKTKMLKDILNSAYGTKAFKYDIKKVIFSGPCTIVFWQDGTKTMVRLQDKDVILDKEKGLAMAIAKRVYGDKGNYNNIFKRWLVGKDWRKKERLAKKLVKASNDDLKEAIEEPGADPRETVDCIKMGR